MRGVPELNKRFSNIRYRYIQSHLYALFIITILLLSVLLFIYMVFRPDWLQAKGIILFVGLYIVIGIIVAVYVGFKSSDDIKERLDHLSVLITQFANGNYQSRVNFDESDELTRIGNEMNDLGRKLQTQVRSLRQMADEKNAFAQSAHKAAVIEERQRLARDLHDAVSQQLFALTMMSEAAVKQLDKNPEVAKEQIQEVATAALKAQTEMRALLLHLRPVDLSGDPLPMGVHKLIKELKERSQIQFDVAIDDSLQLSASIEEHVFRIVQESLSNILRHANAKEVEIIFTKRKDDLFIHIADDGDGFDVEEDSSRKTSYGLKTMRERCEEIGGTFSLKSIKKEGTYIDIRIPC